MKDEQIVQLYWQRSEAAISETAARYGSYLAKIAYNILADFEDSSECINDTYLAAWNSMPEHRPQVLSTYLGKITRQLAINLFRKRNSAKRAGSQYALSLADLEDCIADRETPEQVVDAKQLDEAINTFVRGLSEQEQTLFIGRYFYFDSVKRVAEYCGIRESMAKGILYRTRQKLRNYLAKEGFEV